METKRPITEKQMTLGTDWYGQDVAGWYVTEKFDGVRAYWDGETLWTRGGKQIAAPAALVSQLPAMPLDCELWFGYGTLGKAKAAVNGKWADGAKLIVHDAPGIGADYATRIRIAARAIGSQADVRTVEVTRVTSVAAMYRQLAAVHSRGGEGLVLRNPTVKVYAIGRTENLLKVKRRIDA